MAYHPDKHLRALLSCTVATAAVVIARRKHRRLNRSVWVREVLLNSRKQGAYHNLVMELDNDGFCHFFQMSRQTFNDVLAMVHPHITHQDTNFRDAIKPAERLAVTLHFPCHRYSILTSTKGDIPIFIIVKLLKTKGTRMIYQGTVFKWAVQYTSCTDVLNVLKLI